MFSFCSESQGLLWISGWESYFFQQMGVLLANREEAKHSGGSN